LKDIGDGILSRGQSKMIHTPPAFIGPIFLFWVLMANRNKSINGPIILVEDDIDDQEVTREVIGMVGFKNEIITFQTCSEAFDYLMTNLEVQPFIILSDVNLPKVSGIDFKQRIDSTPLLRQKSIPFVFYSTSADKSTVDNAYQYAVQGFFVKGNSIQEMVATLKVILEYWTHCKHPNN
jgi:CheY-like chemotaxis protein